LVSEVLEGQNLNAIDCLQNGSTGVNNDPAPQPGKLGNGA